MRISKLVSGNAELRESNTNQGRGEYEWCGLTESDPKADDLVDRRILIRLDHDLIVDTQSAFRFSDGKHRVRCVVPQSREQYPPWHAAAALMLPKPNRAETSWGDGLPIMRTQQYGITHLHLGEVDVAVEGVATVQILQVDVQNHYSQDSINFAKRMEHVRRVWEKRGSFDETVSRLIAQHEELIRIDSPLPTKILSVVRQLQKLMADTGHDYGIIPNTRTTDVLPSLLEILDLPQPSAAGVEAGEISADEVVIRLRHIKNERRLANLRGASSVRFRRDVRTAYRATCVVCGLHLPPIGPGGSPGVDAAHILPWSAFDVDHVSNGLCLCKLHHWAFDESLIEFTLENGVYSVLIPDEAVARVEKYSSTFDLSFLKENTGVISDARLPRKIQDRPKPEFLKALKEFLSQS